MNARARLRALSPRARGSATGHTKRRILASVGGAASAVLIVDGYWSVPAGVVAGLAAYALTKRIELEQEDRRRRRYLRQLPFALEAFAACLKTGAPVPQALGWVAGAVGGRLATDLASASRAIVLGTPVPDAFRLLGGDSAVRRVTAAVSRSDDTGAKLGDNLALLASELRDERQHAAQAAAHKAGVWMVLPLCLCFLPAFVLAGLIPIVVSAMSQILHTY